MDKLDLDESEFFEAWWAKVEGIRILCQSEKYYTNEKNMAWRAWQARAALPVEEPCPVDGERVDLRLAGAVFNSFSSRPEIKRHGDAVIAECRRLRQEIDRLRPEGEEQGPRPVEDVPLVYGDTIQAGDECWAAGRGPWMPVGDEREGESFYPWNGNSGIHPPMRRPAASRPLEEGKAVDRG